MVTLVSGTLPVVKGSPVVTSGPLVLVPPPPVVLELSSEPAPVVTGASLELDAPALVTGLTVVIPVVVLEDCDAAGAQATYASARLRTMGREDIADARSAAQTISRLLVSALLV
jgi:hypothetical protein